MEEIAIPNVLSLYCATSEVHCAIHCGHKFSNFIIKR